MALDLDNLTSDQVDALNGHEREAWYAHARGDKAKAKAILAAYDGPAPERAAVLDAKADDVEPEPEVEAAVDEAPETATPAKPRSRTRKG